MIYTKQMVMEMLCYAHWKKCASRMNSLQTKGKIQSWSFSLLTDKVVAVADTDPDEVMRKARDSVRLVRVDWIENPRLKIIEDPSKKWWVDPVEDLREKWLQDDRNEIWVDPAVDPRKKWLRRMVLEMSSCDPDDWVKALRITKRFDDKIYKCILDKDLKKLYLLGDMDPTEVTCCLRDHCRLLTVEWIQKPRKVFIWPDGPGKILVPKVDEEEEERKLMELIRDDGMIPPDEDNN